MAKYIDCDKCYHGRICAYRHHYHDMIVGCNHYAPTADAVEGVECSNCKYAYFNKDSLSYICKRRGYFSEYVRPTDFCSYGERGTDDDV